MKKKQEFKGYLRKIYPPQKINNGGEMQNILIQVPEVDRFNEPITPSGYELTIFRKDPNHYPESQLKELIDKKVKGVAYLSPFQYDHKDHGKRWGLSLNLGSIELWT